MNPIRHPTPTMVRPEKSTTCSACKIFEFLEKAVVAAAHCSPVKEEMYEDAMKDNTAPKMNPIKRH